MKMLITSRFALLSLILCLAACTKDQLPTKLYSVGEQKTEIKWTAYKYTEKFGVSGVFEEFTIKGLDYNTTIKDMVSDVSINIQTESLNTQSVYRDANIRDYYFKRLNNYATITGDVIKVKGSETEGQVVILMDFNSVKREVEFDFRVNGKKLYFESDLDLSQWDASSSLDHLRECCGEYHTGTDGVHLVWPDVRVEITVDLEQLN